MNVKELKPTYTMQDMVKMFRHTDALSREVNALKEQLAHVTADLKRAKEENADLTAQLDDMQREFAQEMTAPLVLLTSRPCSR